MRVAQLHWAFPPVIGGVETHLMLLCGELVARGHEVSLLTGSAEGRPERGIWHGMPIFRTPVMNLNHLRSHPVPPTRVQREIASFLTQCGPDVVHVHNMHYFSLAHLDAVIEWCRVRGTPLLLTAHNVWSDTLWREACQRAQAWTAVIAVSRYIAEELVQAGYSREKIRVVHHGIDTTRFQPATAAERAELLARYPHLAGRKVLFHPARLGLAKGSLVLARALPRIVEACPDTLVVMAGTGEIVDWTDVQAQEIQQVKAEIDRLGLRSHVWIHSFPWEEMPEIYRLASLCVYPSIFEEPFGLAVIEAMACGHPVVVTNAGGMPEIIDHGRTGFIVPKQDPDALADACVEILSDEARLERMSRAAREAALLRFPLQRMVEETVAIYQSLCRTGRVA